MSELGEEGSNLTSLEVTSHAVTNAAGLQYNITLAAEENGASYDEMGAVIYMVVGGLY